MIRLGDVNFALGADTRGLRPAVQDLNRFGATVERVQTTVANSSTKIANDFRKQEKAAVDALDKVLRLSQQMRKTEGGGVFADRAARSFSELNRVLSRGQLDSLQYQRAMERFKASLSNTTREFKAFNDQARLGGGGKLASSLKSLQSGFVVLQGPLGGISTRISTLSSLMGSAGGAVAAFTAGVAVAGLAIYKMGEQILTAGVATQKFTQMFQVVTGNSVKAEAALRKITQIARLTGQSIETLAPSFARFNIAAQDTGLSSKEITREFTVLAQAAGKLQLPAEQAEGIFRALEQMLSKGTVQAEELRGQLGDRLPGAFNMAARALGVTTVQLNKMMKAGEVITVDFLPKFIDQMQKSLSIDPSKPIKNYTASVNNLSTAWYQYTAKLDDTYKVTQKVSTVIDSLTGYIDNLRMQMENAGTATTTFGDYWNAIIGKLGENFSQEVAMMSFAWNKWVGESQKGGLQISITNKWVWAKLREDAFRGTNDILDFFINLAAAVPEVFIGIGQSIADALDIGFNSAKEKTKELFNWINDALRQHAPMPMTQGPLGSNYDLGGYDSQKAFDDAAKRDAERQANINRIMNRKHNTMGTMLSTIDDVSERANAEAYGRIPMGGYRRGGLSGAYLGGQEPESKAAKASVELTDKQVKALDRKKEAMQRITDEIERQQEEVDALGGSEAALESLTDKFKREKEVEKYGRALRKAGVDTEFIKQKTDELLKTLEKKDILMKYREGLVAFRDSLANAFDTIGNSIVDGLFEGENALQSFLNVAKQVAKDIIKTYMQLAILNPIKNALFGLNDPTLSGGLIENVKRAFMGGASAPTGASGALAAGADAWAGMRGMPAVGNGVRGSRMPTNFASAGTTRNGIPLAEVGVQGFTAKVNAKYADRFQGLFDDLDKAGYKFKSLGEGGYSYRKVKGSNNLSNHSYGNAVDINPRDNPWSYNKREDFSKYGINPSEIAKKNGLEWGGNWKKPDTMHFQVPRMADPVSDALKKTTQSVKDMGTNILTTNNSIKVASRGFETFGGGLGKLGTNLANVNLGSGAGAGGGGFFGMIGNFFKSLFGMGGLANAAAGGPMTGLYAKGSAFGSSGVVNTPTSFQHMGGSGVMGEDGEEAIMPLARDGSGNLGVKASLVGADGNGANVYVYVNNNVQGAEAKVTQSKNGNGEDIISVVVSKVKAEIAGDISKGGTEMNSVIEGRYNLKSSAGIR